MKKMYKFCIPGVPYSHYKSDVNYNMLCRNYSENRIRYTVILENQFANEPLITEPINIKMNFYMPMVKIARVAKITHLFMFINNIAIGKIYQKESLIHGLTLNKYYDKEPRIEITIKPHTLRSSKDG